MSLPDATYIAQLYQPVVKPVFFAWLDINTDPVRCNTSGADVVPSGTGDADLDGFTFDGISGDLAEVSPVRYGMGGSESVTAKISGIVGLDDATLALLAVPANWRGRDARLWNIVRNSSNVQQGGYHPYYTGKMTALSHAGEPDGGQSITVTIESYLSVFSQASNRTYMEQDRFDPGDLSAKAAIAIANGNFTNAIAGTTATTFDPYAGGVPGFLGIIF